MRSKIYIVALFVLFATTISVKAETFTAYLSGAQQVPAAATTATGYARVFVDPTTRAFTFTVVFSGLTSSQTASHIHAPGAIGVNAPVVIDFGAVGGTSGTISGAGTMTQQQLNDIRAHLGYVNVHSTNFPGGEIRGQLASSRPVDRDGDGRTDYSVLRFPAGPPSPITFYALTSTGGLQAVGPFGDANTDYPSPGDYDGDGKADITVYRAGTNPGDQSYFFTLRSSNNVVDFIDWGTSGDASISRDYDGDGKTDYAVFRNGANPGDPTVWWIIYSSTLVRGAVTWGTTGASDSSNGDVPVPADYDGDGKVDVAVYRFGGLSPNNTFIILNSSDNSVKYQQWGNFTTDYVLPGDYDGDGKADFCVGRTGAIGTSPLVWWILQSSNGQVRPPFNFGRSSDLPTQGDFDGDGKTDIAVYRKGATAAATSFFYVARSFDNGTSFIPWGLGGDFPENTFDAR